MYVDQSRLSVLPKLLSCADKNLRRGNADSNVLDVPSPEACAVASRKYWRSKVIVSCKHIHDTPVVKHA